MQTTGNITPIPTKQEIRNAIVSSGGNPNAHIMDKIQKLYDRIEELETDIVRFENALGEL